MKTGTNDHRADGANRTFPRIAARLHQEPWLMRGEDFQLLAQGFESAIAERWMPENAADDPVGPQGEDWNGNKISYHPQIEKGGGLALAHVHGTLGRGLSRLAMQCGGYDTGLFREQLKNIREDDSIKALVIDLRSPGGMANGNMAVCKDIRAVADSGKKVFAYVDLMCASAAYFIACACDQIYAHPDAIVGSISTIYSGIDSSKAFEKNGLKLELFATGKFKATGMPGKEWTQEERDNIWERIRPIDEEFKGYVKSRRGIADEAMEGQWWYAKSAPQGIVDSTRFESLGEFVESVYATI